MDREKTIDDAFAALSRPKPGELESLERLVEVPGMTMAQILSLAWDAGYRAGGSLCLKASLLAVCHGTTFSNDLCPVVVRARKEGRVPRRQRARGEERR